jgi:hypothetical protein
LRAAFGPARYLVSGVKGLVKLEGCGGRLELLVPRAAGALASSATPCCFGKACDICEAPLPLSPLPPVDMLPAQHAGAEWQTLQDNEFVLVALLKGTKRLAPCVHLSDGLIDVLAVPKKENMDHLELLKSSFRYLRAADRAAKGKGRGPGAEGSGAEAHTQHDEKGFIIRKALAVRLAPADERHSFNIDGEVHEGRPIEVRVLARAFKCCIAALERPGHVRDMGHLDTAKREALEVAGRVGKHALDLARPLLDQGEERGKKLVEEVQSAAARAVTSAAASPAVRGATDALKSLRLF